MESREGKMNTEEKINKEGSGNQKRGGGREKRLGNMKIIKRKQEKRLKRELCRGMEGKGQRAREDTMKRGETCLGRKERKGKWKVGRKEGKNNG